jgi:hypothetical protein
MPRTHDDDADDDILEGEQAAFDEDPDSADIERFDHDRATCPDCGAEVWDAAEVCPKCFAYLGGDPASGAAGNTWLTRRWLLLALTALLIIGLIFGCWL